MEPEDSLPPGHIHAMSPYPGADYWKSQAKKFCEFCKCWIADNKPSVEFHEKGKRHKENVGKRLSFISKKSQKEYQTSLKVDDDIKKMEEAALKAYMKDVETNPDFTSQLIKEKLAQKGEDSPNIKQETSTSIVVKTEPQKLWYEARSDEGHTYYWHIESGESRWEPPDEGYMSISEQKEDKKKELKRKEEEKRNKKLEEDRKREEDRARLEREKMKSRRVKEEEEKSLEYPMPILGPAPKPDPYGAWKPVEERVAEPVDLQLPQQEFIEIKLPTASEPRVKFKEKTFTNLDSEGGEDSSCFKKRKFNSVHKRNMRQRLDEN